AAQLQDPLAADVEFLHRPGEQSPGRPQLAEQRPLRGGDAQPLAVPVRIPELLAIGKHAQAVVMATDGYLLLEGFVTWHGDSPGRPGKARVGVKGAKRGRRGPRGTREQAAGPCLDGSTGP